MGPKAGELAPTVSPAVPAELRPNVVVVKPWGFSLERTLTERDIIERSVVDAVAPSARVYVTDSNAFFNRPWPRLVESPEIMAACVHPALFRDFVEKHREVLCRIDRAP